MKRFLSFLVLIFISTTLCASAFNSQEDYFLDLVNKNPDAFKSAAKGMGYRAGIIKTKCSIKNFRKYYHVQINNRFYRSKPTAYAYYGNEFKMPDLRKKTEQEIKELFKDSEFNLDIKYINSHYVHNGKIASQSIQPGKILKADNYQKNRYNPNSKIYLVVAIHKMKPVPMPDFRGKNKNQVKDIIFSKSLPLRINKIVEVPTSDNKFSNLIKSQSINPGTKINKLQALDLEIYKHTGSTFVKPVIGMSIYEARRALEDIGLKPKFEYKVIEKEFPEKIDGPIFDNIKNSAGKVISQEKVKQYVPSGSQIKLVARKKSYVTMPDLVGLDYENAVLKIQKLTKNRVKYYNIKKVKVPCDGYRSGRVLETKPKAKTLLGTFEDIEIKVQISGKPMPNLVGMTEKQAIKKVKELGLKVEPVKYSTEGRTHGLVCDTQPKAGQPVQTDNRVYLVVSDLKSPRIPESVIQKTEAQAKAILIEKGFKDIAVQYSYFDPRANTKYYWDNKVMSVQPTTDKVLKSFDVPVMLNIAKYTGEKPKYVQVPNLMGVKVEPENIHKLFEDKGLNAIIRYVITTNPAFDRDVSTTKPRAYSTVSAGSDVIVNIKALKISVPILIHLTPDEAIKEIKDVGLKANVSYEETDSPTRRNTIKSQSPKSWTKVNPGDTVELVVYKSSGMTTIPKLKYKEFNDTLKNYLTETKKLKYKVVEKYTSLKELENTIYNSFPEYKERVKEGSTVTLFVYKVNTAFGLNGKKYDEKVRTLLNEKGLNIRIKTQTTSLSSLDNTIAKSEPSDESKLTKGSTIILYVRRLKNADKVHYYLKNQTLDSYLAKKALKRITDKEATYKVIQGKETVLEKTLVGAVYKNEPQFFDDLKKGDTVKIYVYQKLKKVPNVVGKQEHEAVDILEDLGFGIRRIYDASKPAGKVFSQTQKAGNPPLHAAITLGIGEVAAPKPMASMRLSALDITPQEKEKVKDVYRKLKEAYENKSECQVTDCLSDSWDSGDGTTIMDLEDNLRNMFSIYDSINYLISNIVIQKQSANKFVVSYDLAIKGKNYNLDLTRNEKSSVKEEVILSKGKYRINKTLNGRFWYRE